MGSTYLIIGIRIGVVDMVIGGVVETGIGVGVVGIEIGIGVGETREIQEK